MAIVLSRVASQQPITMADRPRPRATTRMPQTPSQVTQQDMDRPDDVTAAVAAVAAAVDLARPVMPPLVQTGAVAVADGLATVSPIAGSAKLPGQPWLLVV